MGGTAFTTHPTLTVRRLTPLEYATLCPVILSLVKPIYHTAKIPRTAPEKPSHGDIDILAHTPSPGLTHSKVSEALGAKASVKGGFGWSFAVPFSHHHDILAKLAEAQTTEDEQTISVGQEACEGKEACFQVDVSTSSAQNYDVNLMLHEFGDAWMLIGSMITRRDLNVSDKGLALMIPEVQRSAIGGKKKGKLFLTRDRGEILYFLGLDLGGWDTGFETLDELFMWVAGCRLFQREKFARKEGALVGKAAGEDKEKVTGKEKKERGRWMWVKFVDEWLPEHPELGVEDKETRESVKVEVLHRWGRQGEYEKLLEEHRRSEEVVAIWRDLAEMLPLKGRDLGEAMKGLKGLVRYEGGDLKIACANVLQGLLSGDIDADLEGLLTNVVGKIEHHRKVKRIGSDGEVNG